jgi:DNA-binding NarL/FixJ family response regulator
MNEKTIRLLHIEDHPVMIRGLRDIFRLNRDEICVAANAESAAKAISNTVPGIFDIIILDLFLGDEDPLTNIRQLAAHFTGKPIIIYSGHTGIGLMQESFRLGIRGWILKTAERAEIKEIITRVFHHDIIYPQEMLRFQAGNVTQKIHQMPPMARFIPDREQQAILAWLCEGCTTSEIAKKHLRVTISSVEKKLQVMRELAEVKTNYELVALYLRTFGMNP